MISIAKLYALTSVTLRGSIMLIPAFDFENSSYPFDLHILLPDFIFTRNIVHPFLRFLHFVNFHYAGKLSVSSLIQVDSDSLLEDLYKIYLSYWNENAQIAEVPARRQFVEQKIIAWSNQLPKTRLSNFIYKYYSISMKKTDWQRKTTLWKSLRHKGVKKKEQSRVKLDKLKDKYIEIWFEYADKIDFSPQIRKKFPEFIKLIDKLTFKEILEETSIKFCPACEIDLSDYPSEINFCFNCGHPLIEPDQKFCSNCGAELREGAHFCSSCGNKIELN